MYSRAAGSTSVILLIQLESAYGIGKTGLVFNTGSLTAYYKRNTAATSTAISLVTATIGTWTSGGFIEVDATHMPGLYELHIPNAALTTGADSVIVTINGAVGTLTRTFEIQLGSELTVTERTAIADALLTRTMTESYAAQGATSTLAQTLYLLQALLINYAISATTGTAKKLDASTTAATFTYNSSSAPTSVVRAT